MSGDRLATSTEMLSALAGQYAAAARDLLAGRLISVVLFGSVAREEAVASSDIDLLVVVDEAPPGATRRRLMLEPVRKRLMPQLERAWDQGIFTDFSEVIITREEAAKPRRFFLDLVEDATILHDEGGFFAGVLANLRARVKDMGAVRRRIGNVRYWDLKPDFAPGDVVEL